MTTYYCEACKKECTPVLRDVGPSADCCFEARLMVGLPTIPTYCAGSARAPAHPGRRAELAYELHDEADAERTPAERARHRVMGEP